MTKITDDNLVAIMVNQAGFEYDIHSLVKAFYPACNVKVFIKEEQEPLAQNHGNACEGKESSGLSLPELMIDFTKEAVLISLKGGKPGTASFAEKKAEISPDMPRPEVKNRLKQVLYKTLSEYTGRKLPWGTLTGIRPTKIPMSMLEEGKSSKEIMKYMEDVYYISKEKGELAIQIAQREKEILAPLHCENGYSLYIGIPFCPTTCLYCSFTSFPVFSWKEKIGEYLDALDKEIEFVAHSFENKVLDTIYIGGGTPTTLEAEELKRLILKIRNTLDLSNLKEFTVEAGRADSITPEKLAVLKQYGVTRISVNPQTMKQETLDFIGRKHTVLQVKEAFAMARKAGFENINMDLILGLPGERERDVFHTMEEIQKLNPDSLTVHSLAVKRASKLNLWIEENGISSLNNTDEMMQITARGAMQMGMAPYYLYRQKNMSGNFENVGYAREGKYGIYNILIMEEKQTIVACGAGSISKRVYPEGRIERSENVKDVSQYIERIGEMIERKKHLLDDC